MLRLMCISVIVTYVLLPNGSTNSSKKDTIFLCGVFFVLFSAIIYLGV